MSILNGTVARAAACTDSWTGGNGSWTDPTHWSNNTVPGPADDACITAPGTYTVSLGGTNGGADSDSIHSLTVGGSSGTQTLDVHGINGTGNTTLVLASASAVTVHGAIVLSCQTPASPCSTAGVVRLETSSGTLSNAGTITTTAANTAQLYGNLTNTGTVSIQGPTAQFGVSSGSATLENQGAIDIGDGDVLSTSQTVSNDAGGSIVAAGSGTLSSTGTFVQGAGTTSGTLPVTLTGSAGLQYTGSGHSSIEMFEGGSFTLSGDLAGGQSLEILGVNGTGNTTVTASGSFTNAGSITLACQASPTSPAACSTAGVVRLETSSGTLSNAGTITTTAANTAQLYGNLTNTGTVSIQGPTAQFGVSSGSATLENQGAIDIGDGDVLSTSQTVSNDAGGSIVAAGSGTLSSTGTFVQGAGTTSGTLPVTLTGSAGLQYTGSGHSSIEMFEGGSFTLSGDLAGGQSLEILGVNGTGNTTVTASGSFTNAGSITLACQASPTSPAACSTAGVVTLSLGSGTLTNPGSLRATADNTANLAGNVVNAGGSVTVDSSGIPGGSGPAVLHVQGTGPSLTQSAGVTTLGPGAKLTVDGGASIQGGTLGGAGTVIGDLTNGGTVSPAPSPATLTVQGAYTQQPSGFLTANVHAGGNDRIAVTGIATLGGTLQVNTASGFTPTVGQTFVVLSAASVSGQFATTAGLASGPYAVSYEPTDVKLTALQPPPPPPGTAPSYLSVNSVTVPKPLLGGTRADFTVTLSPASSTEVSVTYATSNGTASAPSDYTATSGTLTFAPGQSQETVSVPVVGSGEAGSDKTFFLDLSAPAGAQVSASRGTATIVNQRLLLSEVAPTSAGNLGTVQLTIQGNGLGGNPQVKLTAADQPTITATNVTSAPGGQSLTATVNLDKQPLGVRDVVVTNTGTHMSQTLGRAFTVAAVQAPVLDATVSGSERTGPGLRYTAVLVVYNRGNVNAYGSLVEAAGFPTGIPIQVDGLSDPPADPQTAVGMISQSDTGQERSATVAFPVVPAHGTREIALSFLSPRAPAHSTVADLRAHVLLDSQSTTPIAPPAPYGLVSQTVAANGHLLDTLHQAGSSTNATVELYTAPAPPGASGPVVKYSSSGGFDNYEIAVPLSTGKTGCTFTGDLSSDTPSHDCSAAVGPAAGQTDNSAFCGLVGVNYEPFKKPCPTLGTGSVSRTARQAHAVSVPRATSAFDPVYWFYEKTHQIHKARELNEAIETTEYNKYVVDCLTKHGYLTTTSQEVLSHSADLKSAAALVDLLATLPEKSVVASALTAEATTTLNAVANGQWGAQLSRMLKLDNVNDPNNRFIVQGTVQPQDVQAATLQIALQQVKADCPPPPDQPKPPLPPNPPPPPPPPIPQPVQNINPGDPNNMAGPPGPAAPRWLAGSRTLPYSYTAHFQNKPSATAPAHTVVITDRIDAGKLDPATLQLGPVTFGSRIVIPAPGLRSWSTVVDLRPVTNALVNISAGFDAASSTETWRFVSIDPATGAPVSNVDDGFLPPDVNPPIGEGTVNFTIQPRGGLPTRTAVANAAQIVFDTNAPLATNLWSNSIDASRPHSSIRSTKTVRFVARVRGRRRRLHALVVRWSGHDTGSGIASFAVYVRQGHGRTNRWLSATTAKHARLTCRVGGRYRFSVVAVDRAGNVQTAHPRSRFARCR